MQSQIKTIIQLITNDSQIQTLLGSGYRSKITPMISDQYELFPCITYEVVDSSFRTVPLNAQDISVQFDIYSKNSRQEVENIFSRLNALLNYYKTQTKEVIYLILTLEADDNETDRQLFKKTLRYQLWTVN